MNKELVEKIEKEIGTYSNELTKSIATRIARIVSEHYRQHIEKAYADGFNKVWGDGKAVQIHEHEYIDRAGIPIEKEYFDTTFTQYKP